MKRKTLLLVSMLLATIALWAFEKPTLKDVIGSHNRDLSIKTPLRIRSDGGGMPLGVASDSGRKRIALRSPNCLMSSGAELLGWMSYADSHSVSRGLYDIGQSGLDIMWPDSFYEENGVTLQAGWLRDNKVCGYVYQILWGQLWNNVYVEYDFETGDLIETIQLELIQEDAAVVMQTGAYDVVDDMVYGYGQYGSSCVFMSVSPDAPEVFDVIRCVPMEEMCMSVCYNKYEDTLYGITVDGYFVEIDSQGIQKQVFRIPVEDCGPYVTGLAYYPAGDEYYWNMVHNDGTSSLIIIDSKKQSAEVCENYQAGETFSVLFCLDDRLNPCRPRRPSFTGIEFQDGSTDGVVQFSAPVDYVTGGNIAEMLYWTSYLDGEEYSKGEVSPGDIVEVEYRGLTDAMHRFGLTVTSKGVTSSMASASGYVGNDTPLAPTDVKMTETEVSWSPVTQGVHGAYIDAEAMRYEVYVNGESIGVTKDTRLGVTLPSDSPLSLYVATVKAVCNGMESSMSDDSNKVVGGAPMEIPVYLEPTYDEFMMMSQYDPNGTGWAYSEIAEGNVLSSGQSDRQQDNWLFLPPFRIDDPERLYTFSFDAFTWGEWYTEEFVEVILCDRPDPEGRMATVIEEFSPSPTPANYYGFIQAPRAGTYYMALHCTSSAWQLGVLAMHFRISDDGILPDSPGMAYDVSANAGENGELIAKVSFNLPEKRINGDDLPLNGELKAKVRSAVAETEIYGHPGERVESTVATVQGDNILTVIVSDGVLNGQPTRAEVFTGVEIPADVVSLATSVSEDMMEMRLEWEAPVCGIKGGYIDPAAVTYDIYRYEENFVGWFWQLYEKDVKETFFNYRPDEDSSQNLAQLGVATRNAAGVSGNIVSVSALLGTPYTLPLNENFDDPYSGSMCRPWIPYAPDSSYDGQQWVFEYLYNIDGSYSGNAIGLLGTAWYDNSRGCIGMPAFSTEDCEEVELSFTVLNGSYMPSITVLGESCGSGMVAVGSVDASESEELAVYTFRLPPELIGKRWVRIYFDVEFETARQFVYFEEISVSASVTEMAGVSAATLVAGEKGGIRFLGFDGVDTRIFTMDGKVVYEGNIVGPDAMVCLERGIYLVRAGLQTAKVFVR